MKLIPKSLAILTLFLLFRPGNRLQAQHITHIYQDKGDSLRSAGLPDQSVDAYKADLKKNPNDRRALYSIACAFAVMGQKDSAFGYLEKFGSRPDSVYGLSPLADPDFYSLLEHSRWTNIESELMANYQKVTGGKIKKEKYCLSLYRLYVKDQFWHSVRKENDNVNFIANDKVARRRMDSLNQIAFTELIRRHGWPVISEVGADGVHYASVILQHFDLATMKYCYPRVEQACNRGEASRKDFALLTDRIAIYENRPQTYGTQVFYDDRKKRWIYYPIADEKWVDERRRRVGLGPLREYLAFWSIDYKLPASGAGAIRAGRPGAASTDSVFRQGTSLLFESKSFFETETQAGMPIGWAVRTAIPLTMDIRVPFNRFAYIDVLGGKQCLLAMPYKEASLTLSEYIFSKVDRFGNQLILPDYFTLECEYYSNHPESTMEYDGDFIIYFKDPNSAYKNELNVRISPRGTFELNSASGDPKMGKNDPLEYETRYVSFLRGNAGGGRFHTVLFGRLADYDPAAWHKIQISVTNDRLYVWHDGSYIGSIALTFRPQQMNFQGKAAFGIRNVSLSDNSPATEVASLSGTGQLTTHSIHFATGSAQLMEESEPLIKELATWLADNPKMTLDIVGHTDSTGGSLNNYHLSLNRAEAVQKKLNKLGVRIERLHAFGSGASSPIGSNQSTFGRAQNRRIEFRVRTGTL